MIQNKFLQKMLIREKVRKPCAKKDIEKIINYLKNRKNFCFVRFSDGETEIIRNRYLKIGDGTTNFRGKIYKNKFKQFDSKEFNPLIHGEIREDLVISAIKNIPNYLKGMPHKRSKLDRKLMVLLNGGIDQNITFADLLINSNYKKFREKVLPEFANFENVFLIANFRAKPKGILSKCTHIKVPDNFFADYKNVKCEILSKLKDIPQNSLILSSASSLSNIIGYEIFSKRKDITFIDIGTAINDILSLDENTRGYHEAYFSKGIKSFLRKIRPSFHIRW